MLRYRLIAVTVIASCLCTGLLVCLLARESGDDWEASLLVAFSESFMAMTGVSTFLLLVSRERGGEGEGKRGGEE